MDKTLNSILVQKMYLGARSLVAPGFCLVPEGHLLIYIFFLWWIRILLQFLPLKGWTSVKYGFFCKRILLNSLRNVSERWLIRLLTICLLTEEQSPLQRCFVPYGEPLAWFICPLFHDRLKGKAFPSSVTHVRLILWFLLVNKFGVFDLLLRLDFLDP